MKETNELDFTCGVSDDELTERFKASIRIDNEIKRVKALIIESLGSSSKATFAEDGIDYTVTYHPIRKTGISKENLERMKEVYPEIYSEYVTVSESRRVNIKRSKPKAA